MSEILNLFGLFCVISGSACGVFGAYLNSKTDDLSKIKAFKLWEISNPLLGIYLLGLYFKVWEVDFGISLPILMYCIFMYTANIGKKNCLKKLKPSCIL